jgi:hypothetical protein
MQNKTKTPVEGKLAQAFSEWAKQVRVREQPRSFEICGESHFNEHGPVKVGMVQHNHGGIFHVPPVKLPNGHNY